MLKNYPSKKLQFEFGTLADLEGVEFLLDKEQLEFQCLVPVPTLEIENSKLRLLLVFSLTGTDSIPEKRLIFEPRSLWESLLLGTKLPTWTSDMFTVGYLPLLKDMISSNYNELMARKKFIDCLQTFFGTPLEYDAYNFQKGAFLFDQGNFVFIAHISISMDFPAKQPSVTLSSIGNIKNNKPIIAVYNNFPYSPRWSADELARRVKDFIAGVLPDFKKCCSEDDT